MVMTILEAHVAPEQSAALEQAYRKGAGKLPRGLVQTYLIHSNRDSTLWQIITLWASREALNEMRQSSETPDGVLMFRAAGAEPALSIFEVAAQHTA